MQAVTVQALMRPSMDGMPRRARAAAAVCSVLACLLCAELPVRPAAPEEIRALWVLRTSLTSSDSIDTFVQRARETGFNTLFVQVRGRGDSWFRGGVEPRAPDLGGPDPDFDPLDHVLTSAHRAGLKVHAWVNVDLIASATELPLSPGHLVYTHPEWLMVPRPLAPDLAGLDVTSPGYLGRLARWTRAHPAELEGLYVSPIPHESAAYTTRVIADIAARYPVDGVHLDYVRYPGADFDYSRGALQAFRADLARRLPPAERQALDDTLAIDPFAYADAFPLEWSSFRRARLTVLVTKIRTAVKAARPAALVTAAVAPDLEEAYGQRLQDWRAWLDNGLIDAVCPMAYTQEPARFRQQIAAARAAAGPRPVWAGIGAYRLSPAQTIANIETARRLGAGGIVLFSYDSVAAAPEHRDYLAQVGRAAFDARRTADAGSR
jgi:uncharacterized lipoprotein YddW (UPF0748 family)